MNKMGDMPWPLSFSYGRALQAECLKTWAADPKGNREKAQQVLLHRAKMNSRLAGRVGRRRRERLIGPPGTRGRQGPEG
jgi:fructose-bisphosphate aldolase class 1